MVEDVKAGPHYIWKLNRSLYGLHYAQKDLWNTLNESAKFKQTLADDCVYVTKDKDSGYAASGTQVDEIIVVGDSRGTKKFGRPTLRPFSSSTTWVVRSPWTLRARQNTL